MEVPEINKKEGKRIDDWLDARKDE